uniref:tRNA-splicing endonuclease subunit Sen2 n=1 Tax=Oreochromis niloticus TaxID=8128 RepID=I3IUR2_ORENI
MHADFRAPRRRLRVTEELEAPLPLSPRERSHFRAELLNEHVLVCDPEHSQKIHDQQLYGNGYFGKGVLSRSRPEHGISDQWEREYEELLKLAGSALSAQGWDEEAVHQALLRLSQPIQMDDVRNQMGGGEEAEENGERGEKNLEQEGGVSPQKKRSRRGSEVETEAKRTGPTLPTILSSVRFDSGELLLRPEQAVMSLRCSELQVGSQQVQVPCLCRPQAFFLQKPLSIVQLWRTFRSLRPDFVSSYAAYHHFRSKGWVPKGGGGTKYGVDLMLYRKGPPFYHASYSVVIERADDAFRASPLRPFSWRSLAALSRITANVSKELMLCYVIYPADLSEAELDSPVCLSRLKVQEVIVSRWVSSRERAEQDDI